MALTIADLTDEYSHLEGMCHDGLLAWGVRPLEVRFGVEAEDVEYDREPTEEQLEELKFHIEHQVEVREAILRAFIAQYPTMINFTGGYRDELPDVIETTEEMAALLEFQYIQITDRKGCSGRLLVGFAFESRIDPEHGHGCMLDGLSVQDVGGEEDAW